MEEANHYLLDRAVQNMSLFKTIMPRSIRKSKNTDGNDFLQEEQKRSRKNHSVAVCIAEFHQSNICSRASEIASDDSFLQGKDTRPVAALSADTFSMPGYAD